MIFYVTYNDAPSGIFSSQVIDVVKFINEELNEDIKLVSFISLRNFFHNRKNIKIQLSNSIVLPMFPGIHRWKMNKWLLGVIIYLKKPRLIIGRSVLATQLALPFREKGAIQKIVYDGRGAICSEWHEYKVVSHPELLANIRQLEKQVVLNTDFRIAVSEKLVKYWQKEFDYRLVEHVVIPCTLNKIFEQVKISESLVKKSRELLGLNEDDIVFMYSGSVAGWQSFGLLYQFIHPLLASDKTKRIVFLSDSDANILNLKSEFPDQVICKKVKQSDVPVYLLAGDYGLLIREQSQTNNVASPVKFAEYLACGLDVILSANLGDYTELVLKKKCGYLFDSVSSFQGIRFEERLKNNEIAMSCFRKEIFQNQYGIVCN